MLSAVIRSRHSYGAMHLAVQPPDQRSVHFGPLVLETNLLKNQRLQQIKTNLSHDGLTIFDFPAFTSRTRLYLFRFLSLIGTDVLATLPLWSDNSSAFALSRYGDWQFYRSLLE